MLEKDQLTAGRIVVVVIVVENKYKYKNNYKNDFFQQI